MAKPPKIIPEIVRAAEELEAEMVRLEAIAWSARKGRLNSEKGIAKAASELAEAMSMPERLAERLQGIGAALQGLQERQQAALTPLATLAKDIQERTQLLAQHMERFAALGKAAAEVSASLAREGAPTLAAADTRLKEISDAARLLFESTRADDFPEIAREADVLKQRLTAIRKRLEQLPR